MTRLDGPRGSLRVAIVGGGFSGTMVAAQLARRGVASILIEGAGRLGRGIAYSTAEPAHVLNVRAETMSAWPDDPRDFAEQVEADGGSAKDFAERRRFGHYLSAILQDANGSGLVTPVAGMAVGTERDGDGWTIRMDDGRSLTAQALVLAIGNQEPEPMGVAQGISPRLFINNPWGADARSAVEGAARTGADVLLIGTGLTAVDHILSLDACGHRGRITSLSRRGLLPRGHAQFEPAPVECGEVPVDNVLALCRWLRRRGAQVGWRAAIDALRPHSSAIWQALGPVEQRRFLRHARPWWDVHRHRIAPMVAERLRDLVGSGQLEVVAGRLQSMEEREDGVEVSLARRGAEKAMIRRFGVVFNCTGPLGAMARTRNSILRQMIGDGLVEVDELGIGLAVDDRDRAGDRIWALGPLTKGRYWEIIAVPDIAGQVEKAAADIATELE